MRSKTVVFRKNVILPIQVPGQAIQKHVQAIQVSEEPIQISNLHLLFSLANARTMSTGDSVN